LSVFSPQQLQALALLFLRVNDHGPRRLGIFRILCTPNGLSYYNLSFYADPGRGFGGCGVGWLTFLYPPLGNRCFPYIASSASWGASLCCGSSVRVKNNDGEAGQRDMKAAHSGFRAADTGRSPTYTATTETTPRIRGRKIDLIIR